MKRIKDPVLVYIYIYNQYLSTSLSLYIYIYHPNFSKFPRGALYGMYGHPKLQRPCDWHGACQWVVFFTWYARRPRDLQPCRLEAFAL